MVQCYTCGKFGHIQRNCNPKTQETAGKIQGVNKRPGEYIKTSENPAKKTLGTVAELDDK